MLIANNWKDYELLDCGIDPKLEVGQGQKLERWGGIVLSRPDPEVMWPKEKPALWSSADGVYIRNIAGGGKWRWKRGEAKAESVIGYGDLKFLIKPTEFKHTGIFPEQAANWDWMINLIKKSGRPVKVLNLFAYTGAATVACLSAGAEVCHVDASKGIIEWAKANAKLNNLEQSPVRYLVDDVMKFIARELRRGVKYDAIIMDPPMYGRGTKDEVWKIEKMLWPLVEESAKLLSDKPLFFLLNSYAAGGISATVLKNVLESALAKLGGAVEGHELNLPIKDSRKTLPAGVCARWTA